MNYLRRRPTNNVPAGMGMTETDPVGLPQRTGARTTTTDSPSTGLAYNDTDPVRLPQRLSDLGWNYDGQGSQRPTGENGPFNSPITSTRGPYTPSPQDELDRQARGRGGSTPSPSNNPATPRHYNYGEEGWDSQPNTYTTPNNPTTPRDPRSKSLMEAYGASPIAGMDARTYAMLARYLPGSGTGVDPLASPGQIAKYGGWEQYNKATMNPKVRALWDQFRGYNPNMKDYGDFSGGQMPWEKMGVAMPTGPRPGLGTFESTTNTPNPQFPAAGRTGTSPNPIVTGGQKDDWGNAINRKNPQTGQFEWRPGVDPEEYRSYFENLRQRGIPYDPSIDEYYAAHPVGSSTTTPPPAGSPITTGNRTDVGAYGKAIRGGTGITPGQTPPPTTTTPNPTVGNPTAGTNTNTGGNTQPADPRVGRDPNTGHFTVDGKPADESNMYGRTGRPIWTMGPNPQQLYSTRQPYDPNFYEEYVAGHDDNGDRYGYSLRQDVIEAMGGRVQLPQTGVGGYAEVIDPSLVTYDERFGLMTPSSNISAPDPNSASFSGFMNRYLPYIMAAGGAAAIGAAGGFGAGATVAGEAGATAGTTAATAGTSALETLTTAAAGGIESLTSAISSLLPNVTIPSGMSVGQLFSWARTALSAAGLIRGVTGGGNRTGNRTSGGGNVIDNLITDGVANYQNNRNIQNYEQQVREMIERGDPYGPHRAAGIAGLHNLVANPGSITANPLFSAMNNKSQADLSRVYGARGLGVSGNEMSGLQENFLANMNKFYGDEFNRYARMAGIDFNPASMAAAGINSAAYMFGARNNRNAANSALFERSGGVGGIWDAIREFFGSGEEGMTEDEFNQWWDEFVGGGGNVDDGYWTGGYDDPYGAT